MSVAGPKQPPRDGNGATRSHRFASGRHAGLLLPLFSAPGRESWGIGEIADLPLLSEWLSDAGFDFLQILPLNEMQTNQHSPYAAVSAMAIDPVYVSLRDVPEFRAAGGETALSPDRQRRAADVRASPRIDYNAVRALKMEVLREAFESFRAGEWVRGTERAGRLREYLHRERWWIGDYVLYRALGEQRQSKPWWEWEPELAQRDRRALKHARRELAEECLFHGYVQWLADTQWQDARRASSVGVFGDVSFMVGADSADVWANQHAFRLDATVGAPPDAFSETGQDWGLPVYRWEVFAAEHDAWIRDRAKRNAALFDGYRIDHVVGFYRTFVIPADDGEPAFEPLEEVDQLAQGERVMRAFLASGARIIAEDLGIVPGFVRQSLLRLGIPGYKVLRWEREWDEPGRSFRDPEQYPRLSVATTGTHDTEPLVEWWEAAPDEERALVAKIPFLAAKAFDPASAVCDAGTRDALLEALAASSSDLLILPIQDVFGWRDRINVPATVTEDNWTWQLPWPVEELRDQPEARARAAVLAGWMRRHARSASQGVSGSTPGTRGATS